MTEAEITGNWVHENKVPMGGGVMLISSSWNFAVDGIVTLAIGSLLEHDGRIVNQDSSSYAGRWSIATDRIIVELIDHPDSPFQLSLTESGELRSGKRGGVWSRPAEK